MHFMLHIEFLITYFCFDLLFGAKIFVKDCWENSAQCLMRNCALSTLTSAVKLLYINYKDVQ